MRVPISAHTLRWLRPLLGLALIIHALGHLAAVINAGIRIGASNSIASAQHAQTNLWQASFLTALAVTALLSGGLGALHVRAFSKHWPALAISGVLVSFGFLVLFHPADIVVGTAIGVVLFVATRHVGGADSATAARTQPPAKYPKLRLLARTGWLLLVGSSAVALLLRPMFLRWGSQPHESYYELPGDVLPPGKGFQILHALNINATPDQVWPWLAQIGHDRGGFYSYSWLENLFGLNVVNAERVVPEWQTRRIGELVPATPSHWLGLDHPLGWRVLRFEPGRVLYLENWGAFALVRIDPTNTRFYIRAQGHAGERASLWWSPLELLVFEPAHFIMQRKMMLTIKSLAEASARQQRSAAFNSSSEATSDRLLWQPALPVRALRAE